MDAISQKKGCDAVGLWRKSIVNHVYYVAATGQGDEDLLEAMWLSVANHVRDVHEHPTPLYPMCDHPHLIGQDREKEWLVPGWEPFYYFMSVHTCKVKQQYSKVEQLHVPAFLIFQ